LNFFVIHKTRLYKIVYLFKSNKISLHVKRLQIFNHCGTLIFRVYLYQQFGEESSTNSTSQYEQNNQIMCHSDLYDSNVRTCANTHLISDHYYSVNIYI
jgi:hypothetical protein